MCSRSVPLTLAPPVDSDIRELAQLCQETIERVNCADYTPAQTHAWVARIKGLTGSKAWHARFPGAWTKMARDKTGIVGFITVMPGPFVAMLYVHHARQRRGVGRTLLHACDTQARLEGAKTIRSHVSVSARPAFKAAGYHVLETQYPVINGVSFINFLMEKQLFG